jgi:hypothetical protein
MAKVAKQWLVWQSDPKLDMVGVPLKNELGEMMHDRIEIAMDSVVPDTVPMAVQEEWESKDWIFEDPTKEHVAEQSGPPRMTLPPIMTQKFEHAKRMGSSRGGVPPRPTKAI